MVVAHVNQGIAVGDIDGLVVGGYLYFGNFR